MKREIGKKGVSRSVSSYFNKGSKGEKGAPRGAFHVGERDIVRKRMKERERECKRENERKRES